jgi:holo-[acyl-carrier protein] synthase
MICGIGIDIVDLERIRKLLVRKRTQALKIIFCPAECALLHTMAPLREVSYVAGRLAAKEAVLKALGTGVGPLSLPEIAIMRGAAGQPVVAVQGRAGLLTAELGISHWNLSISHERGLAVAVAVASIG